jgi:Flp pilus assembly protein TadB
MNRLLVIALVAAIGNASAAFAGESILKSGTRHTRELAVAESSSQVAAAPANATSTAGATVTVGTKQTPSFQQEGGTLSKSGMGKGKKTLIYVGVAVGVAASFWAIDHHVLDITPSSLGTRQD